MDTLRLATAPMPANVETMFYVRVAPWHGLGTCVEEALSSEEALEKSGLDWTVIQRPLMTSTYAPVLGYKANIRDTDNSILGVISDRYKIVQNEAAFKFTDALLGEGGGGTKRQKSLDVSQTAKQLHACGRGY